MGNYFCAPEIVIPKTLTEIKKEQSEELYRNIRLLSSISSNCQKEQKKLYYDDNRTKLINKIKQNLENGADVHYYGESHKDHLDNFQLSYVLDQDEVTELMLHYVRNHPPYYNIPCIPFLTHAYIYKGKGYVFDSKHSSKHYSFSISENIYKTYQEKYATEAEKRDLEDFKNKTGKYTKGSSVESYFVSEYNKDNNEDNNKDNNKDNQSNKKTESFIDRHYIQNMMNTRKFIPMIFR
jgi:hypothetical protein